MKHFFPDKERVTVCWCNDGKVLSKNTTPLSERITQQHRTSFQRLWKYTNMNQRNKVALSHDVEVTLVQISFRESDEDFESKLAVCDLFFMAGFTHKVAHVEDIFCCSKMQRKRVSLAKYCNSHDMPIWGVCGSAVALGSKWTLPSRNLDDAQLFGVLGPHFKLIYSGGNLTDVEYADEQAWHITPGTGACIVLTSTVEAAAAFRMCGKRNENKTLYWRSAKMIDAKMQRQIQKLAIERTLLYWTGPRYRKLAWKTGECEWVEVSPISEFEITRLSKSSLQSFYPPTWF